MSGGEVLTRPSSKAAGRRGRADPPVAAVKAVAAGVAQHLRAAQPPLPLHNTMVSPGARGELPAPLAAPILQVVLPAVACSRVICGGHGGLTRPTTVAERELLRIIFTCVWGIVADIFFNSIHPRGRAARGTPPGGSI